MTLCSTSVYVQLRITFTPLPFTVYHYMFRLNWPSSGVQVTSMKDLLLLGNDLLFFRVNASLGASSSSASEDISRLY
jgi:hypothetical protein